MVKSENLYSIQSFCDKFLGFCPFIYGDKDELRSILDANGHSALKDYPLSDIKQIVENGLNVVLVDTTYVSDDTFETVNELRWVEVPN